MCVLDFNRAKGGLVTEKFFFQKKFFFVVIYIKLPIFGFSFKRERERERKSGFYTFWGAIIAIIALFLKKELQYLKRAGEL